MSGFFGLFNYDKPGRGVDKDAPEKRGFFLFFDILFRKFWRIISLSLSYTLFSIPTMVVYFFLAMFLQMCFSPIKEPVVVIYFSTYVSLFLTCFFGAGPASAGQIYVLRNFSREDHSWVWEDLWTQAKANFKQGLCMFLLDLVVLTVLCSAAFLYLTQGSTMPMPPIFTTVFGFMAVILLVIWFMMHFFVYPLMVTLDLKFGVLLKTAAQLTTAKLPQCILIFALSIAVFALFLALYMVNVGLIILFPVLGFSLTTFVYVYYATSVMDAVLEKRM